MEYMPVLSVSLKRESHGYPTGVHIQLYSEGTEKARQEEGLRKSYTESLKTGYFPGALGLPENLRESQKKTYEDE